MIPAVDHLLASGVRGMVRRSVRARFRNLYWTPLASPVPTPAVFYANHHGWMDGYLMHILAAKLGHRDLYWIEAFDEFPLFRVAGGLPYPKGDLARRVQTVRHTVRLLKEHHSLMLFPEGILHQPPELLPFGRALSVLARSVANLTFVPVAIRYEMSMHERPEAWLRIGTPHPFVDLEDCQRRVSELLCFRPAEEGFEVLMAGTGDVNERWGLAKR